MSLKHARVSDAQPIGDHYATLGVMPRSEDVVIRAAYLALMNRYHPDKSSSPASVERAQAIIAAYAVLGDPETRIQYDWARRRAAEEVARPAQARRKAVQRGLIAALVAALVIVPLYVMQSPPPAADRIVRQTAERRALPASRPPSAVPIAQPDLIIASRLAEPIVAAAAKPVATAKRATVEPPDPTVREGDEPPRVAARAPRALVERVPVKTAIKAARSGVGTSAKCGSATGGNETASCARENLAALDRFGSTYYEQSLRVGNDTKRAALLVSRDGFLNRREACRSDSCLRSAYLTHLREISAIVENKLSNPR